MRSGSCTFAFCAASLSALSIQTSAVLGTSRYGTGRTTPNCAPWMILTVFPWIITACSRRWRTRPFKMASPARLTSMPYGKPCAPTLRRKPHSASGTPAHKRSGTATAPTSACTTACTAPCAQRLSASRRRSRSLLKTISALLTPLFSPFSTASNTATSNART